MVVDTKYYNILEIKPDADELIIKKVSLMSLYCLKVGLIFDRHTDGLQFWFLAPLCAS
jgi:hypothetical protein